MDRSVFGTGVIDRFDRLRSETLRKSGVERSTATGRAGDGLVPRVGHPVSAGLGLGQTTNCQMAIASLDLRAFTRRSFWQPLEEVTDLSMAVLGQVAQVVEESGGFVLGLRGDGLMAGWGDHGSDHGVDVAMAMAACAFSLDAVENSLNQLLEMRRTERVQLVAGSDHGEVCFAGTGTEHASEVNVVGFPANFAFKCEKQAKSWEVVVGEGASVQIADRLLQAHPSSPKQYAYRGRSRSYAFYQFAWREIVSEAASAIAQAGGQPTRVIATHHKELIQ